MGNTKSQSASLNYSVDNQPSKATSSKNASSKGQKKGEQSASKKGKNSVQISNSLAQQPETSPEVKHRIEQILKNTSPVPFATAAIKEETGKENDELENVRKKRSANTKKPLAEEKAKTTLTTNEITVPKISEETLDNNDEDMEYDDDVSSNEEEQEEALKPTYPSSLKNITPIVETETTTVTENTPINATKNDSEVGLEKDVSNRRISDLNLSKEPCLSNPIEEINVKDELAKATEAMAAIKISEDPIEQRLNSVENDQVLETKITVSGISNTADGDVITVANPGKQSTDDEEYITSCHQQIESIKAETNELLKQIQLFTGSREDMEYLHLSEMLMRQLYKLDCIENIKCEEVEKRKNEAVSFVQSITQQLEDKIAAL